MQHSKRRFYRTPLWRRIVCYSVAGILLFRLGGLLFRSPAKGLVAPAPGQYAVRQVNDAQVLSLASIGGEGDVAVLDIRVIGIGPLTADEPWRKVAREACADICGDRLVRTNVHHWRKLPCARSILVLRPCRSQFFAKLPGPLNDKRVWVSSLIRASKQ